MGANRISTQLTSFERLLTRVEGLVLKELDGLEMNLENLSNCLVMVFRSTEVAKETWRSVGYRIASRYLRARGYLGAALELDLEVARLKSTSDFNEPYDTLTDAETVQV